MKVNHLETPEKYMTDLNWTKNDLSTAKLFLNKWDKRNDEFYKDYPSLSKKVDLSEREHFRNCVNFWEKRLNHEIKSS